MAIIAEIRLLNPLLALFKELIALGGGFARRVPLALGTPPTEGLVATVGCFLALADLVALAGLVPLTDLTVLVG